MSESNFQSYVQIAANDISVLRRVDVFRVLESCPAADRAELARWMAERRPDLAVEVRECLEEVCA